MREAAAKGQEMLNEAVFRAALDAVPGAWFGVGEGEAEVLARRSAYVEFLTERLERSAVFTEEAERARANLV